MGGAYQQQPEPQYGWNVNNSNARDFGDAMKIIGGAVDYMNKHQPTPAPASQPVPVPVPQPAAPAALAASDLD